MTSSINSWTFIFISSSNGFRTPNIGRSGTDPYGPVHKSSSEGFINRVNPASDYQDKDFQEQLDHLSTAVSDTTMEYNIMMNIVSVVSVTIL